MSENTKMKERAGTRHEHNGANKNGIKLQSVKCLSKGLEIGNGQWLMWILNTNNLHRIVFVKSMNEFDLRIRNTKYKYFEVVRTTHNKPNQSIF